ncbi:unknown [Clostridium sp. CAG:306]|nr:unknown [Clostridium sp. CAG:306]
MAAQHYGIIFMPWISHSFLYLPFIRRCYFRQNFAVSVLIKNFSKFGCITAKCFPWHVLRIYTFFFKQRQKNFIKNFGIIAVRVDIRHIFNILVNHISNMPIPALIIAVYILFVHHADICTVSISVDDVFRHIGVFVIMSSNINFYPAFVIYPRVYKTYCMVNADI